MSLSKHSRELAEATVDQLQALIDDEVPAGAAYAQMRSIVDNVDTLRIWIGDDRPLTPPEPDAVPATTEQSQIDMHQVIARLRTHVA